MFLFNGATIFLFLFRDIIYYSRSPFQFRIFFRISSSFTLLFAVSVADFLEDFPEVAGNP